ncbi:MAG: glycosyltransferase family 2 protein [Clostridia bacterium]
MKDTTLYIVLPCYNEEQVLPETVKRLEELMGELAREEKLGDRSRITLVDDGSRDKTWQVIGALCEKYPNVEGIKLSHNVGHQNALWAGMMTVREKCDAVITIDADLQDDINAIREFLTALDDGNQIVYGVRSARKTDTAFKRKTAHGYYKVMRKLGADLVYDHADYRLLSRKALDALSEYGEVNLFLRGMVPLLGFKHTEVTYERGERFAGESKYPFKKMVAFAVEGITSFSVKPIRWVVLLGALFALMGVGMALYAIIAHALGQAVAGWASIMVSLWVIGGVQLMALGLIGEYVGKLYTEVKHRPRYIVENYLEKK